MALAAEPSEAPFRSPGEFDRTPPQNIAAEQSVLGGMLLSKDAIADVVEALRPTDFYRPAHQIVCEAILDLYGRGEPADAITVSAELIRNGNIARVGGANYLHTLMSSVPTAANAGYYAEIVAEQAILRRLVEAGTRIVQMGYGAAGGSSDIAGSVDEVVDRAQAEVYDVTERRSAEDYVVIESLLQNTLDEIERIESNGGVGTGIPTGFSELDQLTNGLHPGQMITIAGRPGSGKALALDTPLPTPTGWTTMGAVGVGDLLIGADGRPTRVVAATDVMVGRPCYEVEFSDGTVIVADAQHEWLTRTRAQRRAVPENRRAYYLPPDVRSGAAAVVAAAEHAGDTGVTVREMTALVGPALANIVTTEAYASTASFRPQRVHPGGPRLPGPVARSYPLDALARAVHARVDRPVRHAGAPAGVVTTERIAATLLCRTADQRANHSVDCAVPLDLPTADLLVLPYALGAWLGDGSSASASLTCADPQILDNIRGEGIVVSPNAADISYRLQLPKVQISRRTCVVCGLALVPSLPHVQTCGKSCGGTLQARLRSIGVLGNKHIPVEYLRADESQRRALLAGLLDTDGYAVPGGNVVFSVTSRRLAEDVFDLVVGLGYRATVTTKSVAGRTAESSIAYSVAFTPGEKVFGLDRKADRQATITRAGTRYRYIVDVRPVTSSPVRCVQVDNSDHMYLASRSMIPTHNSTLALDIARSAAIKHGQATAMFSLEMGKLEIMMRLFSAEARVLLNNMRSGKMTDEDWTRMARRSGELAQAPFYIDDSPNLTMMEIRAKARRLKQRHDLKLVVIDYLQLMTSGKRVESRQQEVSEFSRAIKLLAKELEVPVIALSQLNRSSEQRTDKKPMLSDLRESGCLPATARIWRADTGAETTIGQLFADGARDVPVWSFDDHLRLVPRTMTHVFSTGTREVFRLTLTSGRTVDATANHPFLQLNQWTPLGELTPGARVAIPRTAPDALNVVEWPNHETILLAHMLGDGSFVKNQPIRYASIDEANLDVVAAAAAEFGITAVRDAYPAARVTTLRLPAPYQLARGRRNPVAAWLDRLGLFGLRSHEKFVPEAVFGMSQRKIALFLNHLWATDGCIFDTGVGQTRVYYASTSRRLADDVARLLTRFGITARTKTTRKADYRPCYQVHIYGAEQQRIFLHDINAYGARGEIGRRAFMRLNTLRTNTNVDTVPREVWNEVRTALADSPMTHRQFSAAIDTKFCGSALWKAAPGRNRLAKVARVLDHANLEILATNDVHWDTVVSIESVGSTEVYDATVLGTHNFIADGIAVHNSIEQDSDVVMLVHREDMYEPESPRAGEADIIVAKHRNGPTRTVTVAFQGHYSCFKDMAT